MSGEKDAAGSGEIFYHFQAAQPIDLTTISFAGYAHRSLAADLKLSVSRDGTHWQEKVSISEQPAYKEGKFSGRLEAKLDKVPEYHNIKQFWVRFVFIAPGWTHTNRACSLYSFNVEGRTSNR